MTQEMPRLRLELDSMRYSIVHAFSTHMTEVGDAIDETLKHMDVGAIVVAQVEQTVPRLVQEVVEWAVKEALTAAMLDEAVQATLSDQANQAIGAVLKQMKRG
jgi:hypothetical protein